MIPAGLTVAGALSVAIALRLATPALRRPPHLRENYRGRSVLGTAGIVLVVPLLVGAAAGPGGTVPVAMAGVGVVMAVLGFLDDIRGDRRAGGFAGHVRELFRGHITTGLVKAVGGGVAGLAAAWAIGHRGVWLVVGGAIVALSANLANLLDLRPGRTLKVWLPCTIALLVAGIPERGERVLSALVGGAIVFLVLELKERIMLGDTGAGLVGAVVGAGALASLGHGALVIVLAILLVATLTSEVVSFTRVIEAVPPLRWADRLGRKA